MTRIITAPFPLHTIQGRAALAAVVTDIAGDSCLALGRYGDPTDDGEAEDDISTERAEEIIAQDPSLVYLSADVAFYGAEDEVVAVCGNLHVYVRTPDLIKSAAPAARREDEMPAGFEPIAPAAITSQDLHEFGKVVVAALSTFIRAELDAAGLP